MLALRTCDATARAARPRPALAAFASVLLVLALTLSTASIAQVRLPDFGGTTSGELSPAEEAELGKAFIREIRRTLTLVEDAEVRQYISGLGLTLGAELGTPLSFFVVRQDGINAFAGPGGHIGVNSGLFVATESESELASVLAHEIAHVSQRHIARSLAAADRGALPALAGLIAAILIGTQSAEAGQAVAAGVSGFQTQRFINLIRANELEADRVGMQLLHDAGFDPRGMPGFFEKLQTATRFSSRPPEYLSTHPVTTSRIADTRARAEQYGYRQRADSVSYEFVKAKLRVLGARDVSATLAQLEAELRERRYRHLGATAYGVGLGLSRSGQFDKARKVLTRLAGQHPERVGIQVAIADNELAAQNFAAARTRLARSYETYPDDAGVVETYARALLGDGDFKQALDVLVRHRRDSGGWAAGYRLEAEAHTGAGRDAAGQLALAEHYAINGQLGSAIGQLRRAAAARDADLVVRERAAARLRELEDERQRLRGR